jgi:4-amino-4-deoxy-L-arabinose transferase-like glycosyltransferase
MSHTTSRALVAAACALYVLLHLVTVARSHIPWFDDTFFASIADTLLRTGEFRLTVSPIWFDKPVYLYGPTYFVLVAGTFAKLGLGVLQYRLTGLIGAFALLGIAFRLLHREGVATRVALAACALMALDPIFLEFLRVGRMDLLAVFFFLLGYLFLVDSRQTTGRMGIVYSVLSGVTASLGVLTTPRPGYLLIPMGLILLHRCWVSPFAYRFAQGVFWLVGFVPLCLAWIAYAFGGIAALLAYFSQFAGDYAGTGLGIVTVQKPLLALLLFFTLLKVVKEPRALLDEFPVFVGLGILLFFLLVKNTAPFGGGYTILVIPFEYMALAWLIANCPRFSVPLSTTTLQRLAFVPLFLLNGGFFLAIVSCDMLLWPSLDPAPAARPIDENIPPGSKVVGDDKFYFLVRRAGSDFQYLERGGTLAERVKYHKDTYGFEYLVTGLDEDSQILRAYRDGTDLVKVGRIETPTLSSWIRYPLYVRGHLIMWGITTNYGGTIYKRIR